MPLESQENQVRETLAKLPIEEGIQQANDTEPETEIADQENQVKDPLANLAIEEGIKQANDTEPETEITLKFTEVQGKMIKELTSALALSAKVIVESAINYVHFDTKDHGETVNQLEEKPKSLDSHSFKLKLAAETSHKLEELGTTKQPNEWAVTGIELLYNRLLNNKPKGKTD